MSSLHCHSPPLIYSPSRHLVVPTTHTLKTYHVPKTRPLPEASLNSSLDRRQVVTMSNLILTAPPFSQLTTSLDWTVLLRFDTHRLLLSYLSFSSLLLSPFYPTVLYAIRSTSQHTNVGQPSRAPFVDSIHTINNRPYLLPGCRPRTVRCPIVPQAPAGIWYVYKAPKSSCREFGTKCHTLFLSSCTGLAICAFISAHKVRL